MTEATETPENTQPTYEVKNVYSFDKKEGFYFSTFADWGVMVDMWGDLIDGQASKAEEFTSAYKQQMASRGFFERTKPGTLNATGMFEVRSRNMLFTRRGPVSIAVLTATQGRDLYVSWRAFFQPGVGFNALWPGLLGAGLIMLFRRALIYYRDGFWWVSLENMDFLNQLIHFSINVFVFWFIFMAIFAVIGFIRHNGDIFYLVRDPVDELHDDEIISLTSAVHRSIIAAADQVGIDSAKLEAKEPYFKTRKKPRI